MQEEAQIRRQKRQKRRARDTPRRGRIGPEDHKTLRRRHRWKAAEREKIQADADRQRQVILADAYRAAQKIKGEGDARASTIYADAYGQNAEFYSFYRSLEAYKATFRNKTDMMVLDPSSEFFQYFKQYGSGRGSKLPTK